MSIGLGVYIFVYMGLVLLNRFVKGKFIDGFFLVMSPYVFIIIINNLFMTMQGFFVISENTIYVHLLAMLIFWIGSICGEYVSKRIKFTSIFKKVDIDNIGYKTMVKFTIVLIIIEMFGKLLLIREYGFRGFIMLGDTIKMKSIFQHLQYLLYCMAIIMFDDYLKRKKKTEIVLVGICVILVFSSFVKYHVISLILSTFIFVIIRKPKYIIKLGMITIGIIILLFASNYIVNFMFNNINVDTNFYLNHLWTYIGGGTLSIDQAQIELNSSDNYSIASWIWQMITSLPSMFTEKIFGIPFSDYDFSVTLPTFIIGESSRTNVMSILGSAYLQGNIFSFSAFMLGWGFLVQYIYIKIAKTDKKNLRRLLAGSVFLAFNMLSFFSSFFVLTSPWETMVWAVILPSLLCIFGKYRKQSNPLYEVNV